jgi:hypothetical protein
LLVTIVLGTLAIGLPILFVLAIRFLWDRSLNLGRSKEMEKLIWQLHRIASAMEQQMNVSFPAVQPGTEEARDIAYLQQIPAQPKAAATKAPVTAATATATATAPRPGVQQPAPAVSAPQEAPAPGLVLRDPSVELPRAGVNSMFDL